MDPNQIPPPPDGSGIVNAGSIPPPPDGSGVVSNPTFHTETSNVPSTVEPYAKGTSAPPNGGDVTDVNNPEPSLADKINGVGDNLAAGFGKGVLQTTSGLGDIIHKVGEYVHPGLGEAIIPQSGLTAEQAYATPHGTAQHIGSGAESVAEFLMGDEALKGLSMADKYASVAKTMKMAENSPRLMKALKIGADAARMGAVQGAQTGVKTGGDVGAAAESGLVGAGTAGVLGGVGSLLGEGASAAGNAGTKVQELGNIARGADSKVDVARDLADAVGSNEADLKSNYGETLRDFQGRTQGVTVPYQESPFIQVVKKELGRGAAETTPFDEAENASRPGSPEVKKLLEGYADLAKEPEVPKPETWVDNNGVTHTEEAKAAEPAKPLDTDLKTWLDRRKIIGERLRDTKGYDSQSLADKRVYGNLLNGIDDTIDNLVHKADDPEITDEYQHLRGNYREHVGAFDDPAIKKITDPRGVSADVASDFLSSKNWPRNQNQLEKVLDPMGTQGDAPLQQFGHRVFDTLIKDATPEDGSFNASKFLDKWGKISPDAKARLFGTGKLTQGTQGPQTLLDSLTADAQGVRSVQRLTRLGLIAGAGPLAAAHPVAAGVLGTAALIGETSGTHAARNFVDFVANNPKTWKLFIKAGQIANSPITQGVGKAAQIGATNAAGRATEPDKDKQ